MYTQEVSGRDSPHAVLPETLQDQARLQLEGALGWYVTSFCAFSCTYMYMYMSVSSHVLCLPSSHVLLLCSVLWFLISSPLYMYMPGLLNLLKFFAASEEHLLPKFNVFIVAIEVCHLYNYTY